MLKRIRFLKLIKDKDARLPSPRLPRRSSRLWTPTRHDVTRNATNDAARNDATTNDATRYATNDATTYDAATHDATTHDAATHDALTYDATTNDATYDAIAYDDAPWWYDARLSSSIWLNAHARTWPWTVES